MRSLHSRGENCAVRSCYMQLRVHVAQLNPGLPIWDLRLFGQRISNFIETALQTAGAGIENQDLHASIRPLPLPYLRLVDAVLMGVSDVLHDLIFQPFGYVRSGASQTGNSINGIQR
jgi:hypothetical protein